MVIGNQPNFHHLATTYYLSIHSQNMSFKKKKKFYLKFYLK